MPRSSKLDPVKAAEQITVLPPTTRVVLLVEKNPKRPGTGNHARFRNMMRKIRRGNDTLGDVRQVVTIGDLRFNLTHGFIDLWGQAA